MANFFGTNGNDKINGSAGNDSIIGRDGNDDLIGEAGNDTIIGGLGNDYIDGGSGNDRLDASSDLVGFGDTVQPGLGQDTIFGSKALFSNGRDGIGISYSDISDVGGLTILIGPDGRGVVRSGIASEIRDSFSFTKFFEGSQDADLIRGHDEATGTNNAYRTELFSGLSGNDTIHGGTGGFDIIDYSAEARGNATARGVTVNFSTGRAIDSYGDIDRLFDIERVRGTFLSDSFAGSGDQEYVGYVGLDGADTITGSVLSGSFERDDDVRGFDEVNHSEDFRFGGTAGIRADLVGGFVRDGFGDIDTVSNIDGVRGTRNDDFISGSQTTNILFGFDGNDTMRGLGGDDALFGGDGTDRIEGGSGNDTIEGGETDADLRDVIFGGDGDDDIDGGYGNDELRGDGGSDIITGGFGGDTVIGGIGDDSLSGGAFGDLIFGGDGFDFINGGFGSDRMNGGGGNDRFFHLGIRDHGSDWIQDYSSTEGDILVYGKSGSASDFQVNLAFTATAGVNSVQEAFVIFRPTGQILWALVDGAEQDEINISIDGQVFDLL